MGKAKSYEMINDRNVIMGTLIDSDDIKFLLGEQDSESPEDTMLFKKIFPHEYIPDIITDTKRYIAFEISTRMNSRNKVYKTMTIHFFVSCHQDVVRYMHKGIGCLWYDQVVCTLDELFSEKDPFGVGAMELVSNDPYYPQSKFKGRHLIFQTLDYTDGRKYGK